MNTPRNDPHNDVCRESIITPVISKYHKRCFSWSAVIAGALVGVGISFLLNVFAVAIGLGAFAHSTTSTQSLALGGLVGLAIIAIVSMSVTGYVAGHLGGMRACCLHRNKNCNHGVLYGFTAWCAALLLTVLLSAHIGEFVSFSMIRLTNPSAAVQTHYYPNTQQNVASSNQPIAAVIESTAPLNEQDAAKKMAITAFVAFCLFFIGALSACIAGYYGYKTCERECAVEESKISNKII